MANLDWIKTLHPPTWALAHLEALGRQPRVLWYPSSGNDWRDLLYLHPDWLGPGKDDPAPPDLYLHTDAFSGLHPGASTGSQMKRSLYRRNNYHSPCNTPKLALEPGPLPVIHEDDRTRMEVLQSASVLGPDLPLSPRLILTMDPPERPAFLRPIRVYWALFEVTSNVLGRFQRLGVQVVTENAAFLAKVLLSHQPTITHLCNVRYGGGLGGGGFSPGTWMENALEFLGTEVLISGAAQYQHFTRSDTYALPPMGTDCLLPDNQERFKPQGSKADGLPLKVFPELDAITKPATTYTLRPYRSLPEAEWGCHGDVRWYLVEGNKARHPCEVDKDAERSALVVAADSGNP